MRTDLYYSLQFFGSLLFPRSIVLYLFRITHRWISYFIFLLLTFVILCEGTLKMMTHTIRSLHTYTKTNMPNILLCSYHSPQRWKRRINQLIPCNQWVYVANINDLLSSKSKLNQIHFVAHFNVVVAAVFFFPVSFTSESNTTCCKK